MGFRSTTITFADTKIIRDFEGHSLKAYPDPATKADPWTISYGLTGDWVTPGLSITQEESDKKFMEYISRFCRSIDALIEVELTKNQYMAVLSLVWNIGPTKFKTSTLLKLLNNKQFKEAAEQFLRWDKAGGKPLKGLTNRRVKERELFLK
jgi:lysozyme